MKPPLTAADRIYDLGQAVAGRIMRAVITELEDKNDGMFSGNDGLKNTWEEICVQVQHEESVHWEWYDRHVREMVARHAAGLPENERRALWLQTPEGEEWGRENDVVFGDCPVLDDEITEYVAKCIYNEASNFINPRIREYMEGMGYL
jgi:hypothetical protein